MFFIINTPMNLPIGLSKAITIKKAFNRLHLYRLNTPEIMLDAYFMKNRGKTLKTICKELLLNSQVAYTKDHLILRFGSTDDDRTAKLITYGNGKLHGSRILQYALFR
jgi:hypothetical protein